MTECKNANADELAEFHKTVRKLNSDAQGDLLDVMCAMLRSEVSVDTIMCDARRLVYLRHVATTHGLRIEKRFNRTFSESGFMLVNIADNSIVSGVVPALYSLSFDKLEAELQALTSPHGTVDESVVATA